MPDPSDDTADAIADDTAPLPAQRARASDAHPSDAGPSDAGPSDAGPLDTAGARGTGAGSRGSEQEGKRAGGGRPSRAGWWAITLAAAAALIIGLLLAFGPARSWTPIPLVFLGYFLISGLVGLIFWKGVRELRDGPSGQSPDGQATTVDKLSTAAATIAIIAAFTFAPALLGSTPHADALPCPDGTQTCGPQPTLDPGPTQGNGAGTTAPHAPNTTVPGYTPDAPRPDQGAAGTPTVHGGVRTMPTPDPVDPNACIFNCGPTRAPAPTPAQVPQATGQATAPPTQQQPTPDRPTPTPATTTPQNITTTTPPAPSTTRQSSAPETTTSRPTSHDSDQHENSQNDDSGDDSDDDKNNGTPYQAAELAALAGTYRRRKKSLQIVYKKVHDVTIDGGGLRISTTTPDMSQFNPPNPNLLTVEQLEEIVPSISNEDATAWIGPLNDSMRRAGIATKKQVAAYVATLAVESDHFKTFTEYDSGAEYEGRADLGNTQPGDGVRFKGRGAIQLTGRANYEAASKALGLGDLLVRQPELAATPQYAFLVSEWFWSTHDLNDVAESQGIRAVSLIVNGGTHGMADRVGYFNKAMEVLGA